MSESPVAARALAVAMADSEEGFNGPLPFGVYSAGAVHGNESKVILDRGGIVNTHPGNKHLEDVVRRRKLEYKIAARRFKKLTTLQIWKTEFQGKFEGVIQRECFLNAYYERQSRRKEAKEINKKTSKLISSKNIKYVLEVHNDIETIESYPRGVYLFVADGWLIDSLQKKLGDGGSIPDPEATPLSTNRHSAAAGPPVRDIVARSTATLVLPQTTDPRSAGLPTADASPPGAKTNPTSTLKVSPPVEADDPHAPAKASCEPDAGSPSAVATPSVEALYPPAMHDEGYDGLLSTAMMSPFAMHLLDEDEFMKFY